MTQLAPSFDQLAQMSIFAGLSDEQRRQIVEIASTVEFSPGETILRQGDSSQNLWIVVEGQCEVTRAVTHQGSNGQNGGNDGDEAIVLAELGPYSQFG
ncbi:MAG: cyclic nucleotide-binding domain-containing protein, partial [Planctomycetes bacterium]|nr:cyclic nucleotide-binding domain-containing protein [Planctomycetota bacterium]